MGASLSCCASPGEQLRPASGEDLDRLRRHGWLVCVATPTQDFDGRNQLSTLYVAEYERGVELTFSFLDEDRPNACEDRCYDCLRRPLFGRYSDLETVFIVGDSKVEFPGTYAGTQTWNVKTPSHGEASVDLSEFDKTSNGTTTTTTTPRGGTAEGGGEQVQEQEELSELPIVWVNTWNHLFGETNNNPDLDVTYMRPRVVVKGAAAEPAGAGAAPSGIRGGGDGAGGKPSGSTNTTDFVVRWGSRAEVDARFRGVMTSVSTIMTDDRQERLGKRLF